MTTTTATADLGRDDRRDKLPLAALLALFAAGFLGILNETVPAGLLPRMARGMDVSEAAAGQTITVYALATALTAVPLSAAFARWSRRTLLVAALATFVIGNAVVAVTDNYVVVLAARLVSGVGAGLVWSNIGAYAARLVPERLQGKAIAVAMAGIPAALSLGLPAGTLLGDAAGWQLTFVVMAAASGALVLWVLAALPDLPGSTGPAAQPFAAILRRPGVPVILAVAGGYMVAHNLLYTYIGPLADRAGIDQLTPVLLVFGVTALLSIWATGALVPVHHRLLVVLSALIVGAATLALAFTAGAPVGLYVAVAAWGLGFGGSATLFVTAGMRAAQHDAFQAMLVTVYNVAIAAGGLFGGLLLSGAGVGSIPWVSVALLAPAAVATIAARRHAFPHHVAAGG